MHSSQTMNLQICLIFPIALFLTMAQASVSWIDMLSRNFKAESAVHQPSDNFNAFPDEVNARTTSFCNRILTKLNQKRFSGPYGSIQEGHSTSFFVHG